ncbi:MAG: P1 family peptidase [Microthrixaceae bacterium]|nr:P1 family peptidase [Microthrixaceae bacterium]
MIDLIDGLRVGHTTHAEARTGCTVVLAERAVTASGEVRGSAPATREFALLDPLATVQQVDAVVLSGGSAFGLAAGDGAMGWLADAGRGFETAWGRVPIVVGMSLFDLPEGDPTVHPSASDGRLAARAASEADGSADLGLVGAGTGATVSKWRGPELTRASGLVGAVERDGDVVVAALVALNAWGDIVGSPEAALDEPPMPGTGGEDAFRSGGRGNTTIGVVATNAAVDKAVCAHMARGAHDGLARAVSPPHASVDGDAFVALATGEVPAVQDQLRWMAVKAVEAAITSVGTAGPPR